MKNCAIHYNWLSQYPFDSTQEVQDYAGRWLWFYNHERPKKANGSLSPQRMPAAA